MKFAYETIQRWFDFMSESDESVETTMASKLLNHVKVIWFELAPKKHVAEIETLEDPKNNNSVSMFLRV